MKSQYRAIIAVVLSAAFFLLWYTVISPPKKPQTPPDTAAPTEQAAAEAPVQAKGSAAAAAEGPKVQVVEAHDPQSKIPLSTVTLKNDLVEMEISNEGGTLKSWKVLKYTQTTDKGSPLIDLAEVQGGFSQPLALELSGTGVAIPERPRYEVVSVGEDEAVLRWRSPGEIAVVKRIQLEKDRYVANVTVEITNESAKPMSVKPGLDWTAVNEPQKKGGFFGFLKRTQFDPRQPVYYLDGDVHREKDADESVTVPGAVYWSGIESRYFISAIIPRVQGEGLAAFYGAEGIEGAKQGTRGVWAGTTLPAMPMPAGQTASAAFTIYSGPKDIHRLKAMGVRLDKAIDYGWFTVIAVPILYVLKFFYGIVHNYGVAIILLTILIKLLLHPINIKSLKSMKAMQQLQPKLKELQAKYKGDKQRLNQETMQLFRAHKVNPMGGCLPMILQLPIYIALYKVLWSSIELYHAPFFWFYRDLSAPDPYMITPILLGVFMLAQQRIMPSASADPAQKKMMMLMPIMFTVFMLFLPVGLVIYILVNTGMSVTQQYMYNKGVGLMDLIRGRWKMGAAKA